MSKAACARRISRMNSDFHVNSVYALLQCCVRKGCVHCVCRAVSERRAQRAKLVSEINA